MPRATPGCATACAAGSATSTRGAFAEGLLNGQQSGLPDQTGDLVEEGVDPGSDGFKAGGGLHGVGVARLGAGVNGEIVGCNETPSALR